ncbi:hypothetical protein FOCC_FOCC017106 [Frankliniella occidentalis]|nr:hypothetical protein FOCC_FOCC017106 [Frankliniella occidentalis]
MRRSNCRGASYRALRKVEECGKTQYNTFVKTRLESNEVSIFAPIKKNNLSFFGARKKKCHGAGHGGRIQAAIDIGSASPGARAEDVMPCANTVRNRITDLAAEFRAEVMKRIKEAISDDSVQFTSPDYKLENWNLCTPKFPLDEATTAVNIKNAIFRRLVELGLTAEEFEKLEWVTDQGSNFVKGLETSRRDNCFAHLINTVLKTGLNLTHVEFRGKAVKAVEEWDEPLIIQKYLEVSKLVRKFKPARLKKCPPEVNLRALKKILKTAQPQYHSFILMMKSVVTQKKMVRPTTMYVLRSVILALKPVEQICSNLSVDTYVTASAVLPVMHLLEAGFEDDDDVQDDDMDIELDENDYESLKPAILQAPILEKLHHRYDPEPLDEAELALMTHLLASQARIDFRCAAQCNKLLTKVSFLDPRYKEELTPTERAIAKDLLKEEFRASAMSLCLRPHRRLTVASSKPSLSGLFAKRRKTAPDEGGDHATSSTADAAPSPELLFNQELARFENVPPVDMDVDIHLWWKERLDAYPRLAALARKYLCVPATSTASERLFSTGGNIVTDTRNCLGGEPSENLIFLSSNKNFIKKPN